MLILDIISIPYHVPFAYPRQTIEACQPLNSLFTRLLTPWSDNIMHDDPDTFLRVSHLLATTLICCEYRLVHSESGPQLMEAMATYAKQPYLFQQTS